MHKVQLGDLTDPEACYYTLKACDFHARYVLWRPFGISCKPFSVVVKAFSILIEANEMFSMRSKETACFM